MLLTDELELDMQALGQFLQRSEAEGQSAVLREFRAWVRTHAAASLERLESSA